MVPWWLPVDLPNISAITDRLETWLVPIERFFQGLSVAIETVRIDGELMEIWPNEVCDSFVRRVWFSGRGGFCITQPAISVPWSPVNKFTILTIKDPNTIDSELVDILPLTPLVPTLFCKYKWEKRLPKLLLISALDMWETSCHKLHSAISLSILHQFSRSQWLRKALKKTFRSVPVTSRGNQ